MKDERAKEILRELAENKFITNLDKAKVTLEIEKRLEESIKNSKKKINYKKIKDFKDKNKDLFQQMLEDYAYSKEIFLSYS